MRVTGTIRDCIRDHNRLDEIADLIEEGRDQYGSQSFDQHLMELVKSGQVEFKVAKAAANNPTDFDLKMNTFGGGDTGSRANAPSQDMAEEMSNFYRT
jgi:twitching motility protein PilT